MKCIILAAGYATRLYPLTEHYPKPLLQVGNKTILDWLVEDIDSSGLVKEFCIVTNHKFAAYFEEWAAKKNQAIQVLDDGTESNETRLGAVKDILFAIKKLEVKEDVLVIAGDNLLDFSLNRFLAYAKEKKSSCVMRYYEPNDYKLQKSGVVTIDEEDKVIAMTEKSATPTTHWCCPPFYYFTATDVYRVEQGIHSGCGTDAPGSFIAWLCKQTDVYAMEMPGSRYDIGDLASYEHVKAVYGGITIC